MSGSSIRKSFYDSAVYMYMFLLVGSALFTLYPYFTPVMMAFMALLWGLLAAGTALWMLERVQGYQNAVRDGPSNKRLPDHLLDNMHRSSSYSKGVRAAKSYSAHNLFILSALFVYVAWAIWAMMQPLVPPVLHDLNEQILYALRMGGGEKIPASYRFFSVPEIILRNIIPLFVLVLAFWLGQVFGHSSRGGEMLTWFCFALFVVFAALLFMFSVPVYQTLSLDSWQGYGWGRRAVLQALGVIPAGELPALQRRAYTLGMPGVILGYLPGFIAALVLLRNAFTKAGPKIKILAGLCVLCILLAVDMSYPNGAAAFGLHLAGWSALAFLTIRGRNDVRKIYRLYQ